jgi:hypothetical protein
MPTNKASVKRKKRTNKKKQIGGDGAQPTLTTVVSNAVKDIEKIQKEELSDPLANYQKIQNYLEGVTKLIEIVTEATNISPDTQSNLIQKLNDAKTSLSNASLIALTSLKTTTASGGGRKRRGSIGIGGGDDTLTISPMIGGFSIYSVLESWGLNVKLGATIGLDNFQLGGTDSKRAADFQAQLDDISVKAIWCARGGYGTVRIIDSLDFTKLKKHPKWIMGFSDVTVLHSQLNVERVASLHSIMPFTVPTAPDEVKETLRKALFGETFIIFDGLENCCSKKFKQSMNFKDSKSSLNPIGSYSLNNFLDRFNIWDSV